MSNYGDQAQPALLNAFLLSTKDALMVFEAARRGICPVVTRRLHDSEKASLVVSGSVFAFDEHATGIKRWTDGTLWSPSRIIGNYLVYRELEKKGNKTARGVEAATEPTSATLEAGGSVGGCAAGASEPTSPVYAQNDPFDQRSGTAASQSQAADLVPSASSIAVPSGATGLQRDIERALIGSLTTSYKFKKGGLVKKTISNGSLHLICYYSIEDVVAGRLRAPSSLMELASLEISPSLLDRKNFRLPPLTELDSNGELRYVGEEADPASNPGSIGPMVSPTVSSRPLDTPHHSSDSQALGAMFESVWHQAKAAFSELGREVRDESKEAASWTRDVGRETVRETSAATHELGQDLKDDARAAGAASESIWQRAKAAFGEVGREVKEESKAAADVGRDAVRESSAAFAEVGREIRDETRTAGRVGKEATHEAGQTVSEVGQDIKADSVPIAEITKDAFRQAGEAFRELGHEIRHDPLLHKAQEGVESARREARSVGVQPAGEGARYQDQTARPAPAAPRAVPVGQGLGSLFSTFGERRNVTENSKKIV